ncbi:hypothetical protein C6P40_000837 [Pichia californica]|uniref:Uncharacterized protein n=1 Tax=Pichia californica TaxID=460514 RepID=A0A9P6WJZ9_9ASCO|nr:hypothetical protein C6P42_000888 [[Candida] californica]KAG0688560.1 hypothetical protein C6P40_000837 [[Candida] californica]
MSTVFSPSEDALVLKKKKSGLNNSSYSFKEHRKHYSLSFSTGWKKLLWLKQPYEDNYTDASFLSQLKRNSTVVKYSYRKLVSDFSLVVLHLSLIMSVIVVFYGTYRLNWNPLKPAMLSTALTFAGFIFYVVTLNIRRNKELIELQQLKIRQLYATPTGNNISSSSVNSNTIDINEVFDPESIDLEDYLTEPSPPNFYETFKSSMLIILYLLTLSPVLKSLTNSTSSDSIWALSAWLSILNVMFNDYQIDFPRVSEKEKRLHWQTIFKQNYSIISSNQLSRSSSSSISKDQNNLQTDSKISLLSRGKPNFQLTSNRLSDLHTQKAHKSNFSKNIAVSNAIVLASRLQSNASAFSFILFCIQACGLFPIFNNFTRRCELQGFHYFQLTSIVLTVDVIVWYLFGLGWFIVWISLHLLIVIVGPWYFLTLQKYKDELQGPWDPAKPIVKSL